MAQSDPSLASAATGHEALPPALYAPPLAGGDDTAPTVSDVRRDGHAALLALPVGIGIGAVTLGLFLATEVPAVGFFGFGLAALVTLYGAFRGFRSTARTTRKTESVGAGFTSLVIVASFMNLFATIVGGLFAWFSTITFSRGRQLRSFGRVLLPPVTPGSAWTKVPVDTSVPVDPELRRGLAAQWRENGRTEHASVAAFARLTLDLMSLGAPPDLVAAANRDALDEIRHTELCFSLARALDGSPDSPSAFPAAARARTLPSSRTLALSILAVDSLVDGALHEGVSARVIAALAKRCEHPEIRAVLKEIAADEGRHAAHGWEVVEWCLEEGGRPVAGALRGALKTLPHTMHSDLPAPAEDGSWERYGIHGRELEACQFKETRAHIVQRIERLLAAQEARAQLAA
ncbi:MAG: ferritin-like domain-containing protein [Polyangiaceae bacterium]